MTYKIHRDGETKTFEDEDEFNTMCQMLDQAEQEYTTTEPESSMTKADGGTQAVESEGSVGEGDTPDIDLNVVETQAEAIPAPSNLTSDSLEVISQNADHFTDTIKGKVVINRQGYAVLSERFDISVTAEPVTLPSETDFEYAEFRAIAVTDDGQEYSGFGSAHVKRGDDKTLLAELAETRAMKRSAAWATGVGMTAMEEMTGENQ